MEKKLGRSPIKVIESKSLSQIIFLIADGKNYAQKISELKGIEPSPAVRQLTKLYKMQFLNKPKEEPLLNKRIYSIKWEKIIKEFLEFLKMKKIEITSEAKKVWSPESQRVYFYNNTSIDLLDESSFIKNYTKNQYLVLLMNETFKIISGFPDKTIRDVFEKIIKIHPSPLEYWSGWRLGEEARKLTKEEGKKNEEEFLEHVKSHDKKESMKFSRTSDEKISLLNQLSEQISNDKDKLKKADKELLDYDILMEICSKLSLEPIEDKIEELYPHLIKKILDNNNAILSNEKPLKG